MRTLLTLLISACFLSLQAQPNLIPYRKGNKWGYCDKNKQIIINPQYQSAGFFVLINGRKLAKVKKQGKYGFIDDKGSLFEQCNYDDIHHLTHNLFTIKKENNWYLKPENKAIRPTKYDSIFVYGAYLKVLRKQKSGLLNVKGKTVIPLKYDKISSTLTSNIYKLSADGKKGLFDLKKEKLILPLQYEDIVVYDNDDSFVVHQDNRVGVVDPNNKWIIPPFYNRIYKDFGSKYYIVRNGLKTGCIDNKGRTIFKTQYGRITYDAKSHQFAVWKGNQEAIFNEKGKMIQPFKFKELPEVVEVPDEEEVIEIEVDLNVFLYKAFQIKNKWGFKDEESGKVIIQCKYDAVKQYNQYNLAMVKINGKWGYIDRNGKEYFEE